MHRRGMATMALMIAAAFLAAGTSRAGLVLESLEGETLISRDRAAILADDLKTVLDGRERTYLVINPREKLYAQGPLSEYCELFEELRQALAGLTGEEGAPSGEPARYEVKALGKGEPVSGFAVTGYRILRNGEPETDIWVATGKAIERETADLGSVLADFTSCVTGRAGAILAYREVFRKGVPVRQVSYEKGRPSEDANPVTAIEVRDVPESAFEPPPGYRRVPLAQVTGGGTPEAEPAYAGPAPAVEDLIAPPVPLNPGGRQLMEMKGMTETDRLREVPLRDEVGLPAMPGAYFTMSSTGTSGTGKPIREAYLVTTESFRAVDAWYRSHLPEEWEREEQGEDTIVYRPGGADLMEPPYVSIQKTDGQGMDLMFADLPGAKTRIVLGYWEGGAPPEEAAREAPGDEKGPAEDAVRTPSPASAEPEAAKAEDRLTREGENVVVKDAKEVTGGVVDDTRGEVKNTLRETSKDKVKGFLKGLFNR